MAEKSGSLIRHCAFCLQKNAKQLCGGCHKRAYCSKECQTKDWKGTGQNHKFW